MYVVMWGPPKRSQAHIVPTLEDAVALANSIHASDSAVSTPVPGLRYGGVTVHDECGRRVYDTRRYGGLLYRSQHRLDEHGGFRRLPAASPTTGHRKTPRRTLVGNSVTSIRGVQRLASARRGRTQLTARRPTEWLSSSRSKNRAATACRRRSSFSDGGSRGVVVRRREAARAIQRQPREA
jgi:hypothetical protein